MATKKKKARSVKLGRALEFINTLLEMAGYRLTAPIEVERLK